MLSRSPSIHNLNQLITQLSYIKKDLGIISKQYLIIEKMKKMTDLIIWGDKYNPAFFETFKESKIIDLFFEMVLRGGGKDVIICSIDCFSKLLININNSKSIAFLISGDTMNNMLSIKFKALVIQVAEYYINFLKTLSQKLNDSNIYLFISAKNPNMPIAWQTIRFIHHPQSLIRNTSRNIILSIMKLRDQSVVNYLSSFPFVIFYSHFSSLLRSYWDNMNVLVENQIDPEKFTTIMNEYDDLYLYFEDMLQIVVEPVRRCLLNGFLCEAFGFLVGSLLGTKKTIGIRSVFYILGHIISNTQSTFLADFVCMMLFGRFINNKIILACTSIDVICSFRKQWNFRTFWDNYEDKLKQQSLTVFSGKQIPKLSVKPERKQINRFTQYSNNFFGESNAKYQSQLRKLSMVYGFPHNNIKQLTTFDLFVITKHQINQNQLSQNTYIENSIRKTILKCLNSLDDTLVTLSLKLIIATIINKRISNQIILFSCLSIHDQTGQKQNKFFIYSIVKSCITALKNSNEGQSLKIQTIKIIIGVISKIFEPKSMVIGLDLKQQLINIYQISIEKANHHLLNAQNNWQKTLQVYEAAQIQCNKKQTFKMSSSDLLFMQKSDKTFIVQQTGMYDFVFFILLRNLRYQLFPTRTKLSELGFDRSSKFRSRIQYNKQLTINDFANQQIISCKYKQINQNKYSNCFMVISKFTFIVLQSLSNKKLKAIVDSPQKQVVNMIDRSDPRKLIIITNQPIKRNIFVLFDDAKSCYLIKSRLDSLKTESMRHYLSDVLKHIDMCFQDLTITV